MSQIAIAAALESALLSLSPPIASEIENIEALDLNGQSVPSDPRVPEQRISFMWADPDNIEMSDAYTERGILQVDLRYPLKEGDEPARARGDLIRGFFRRGRSFSVAGGPSVSIETTPTVGTGRKEDDRYVIPVRVRFYSHIPRS